MKRRKEMIFAVVFGICLVLGAVLLHESSTKIKEKPILQPEGEIMTQTEAELLLTPLFGEPVNTTDPSQKTEFLRIDELSLMLADLKNREQWQNEWEQLLKKYNDTDYVLRQDFFQLYDKLLKMTQAESVPVIKTGFLLGTNKFMPASDNRCSISELTIALEDGFYELESEEVFKTLTKYEIHRNEDQTSTVQKTAAVTLSDLVFHKVSLVMWQGKILSVRTSETEDFRLKNAFVMETKSGRICYRDMVFAYPSTLFQSADAKEKRQEPMETVHTALDASMLEQVVDLQITEGKIAGVFMKKEKINGKLLRVDENGVELAGIGFVPFAAEVSVYHPIGVVNDSTLKDLPIGYDVTDFVLEDGMVSACLIVRKEQMDRIRVLLSGPEYQGGKTYESITFVSDTALTVLFPDGGVRQTKPSEEFTIASDDFSEGDRIFIGSDVKSKRTKILEVKRNQGNALYRGEFELFCTKDGFVVINELPLEEYLLAVVPSEMPAGYPLEALKAQAVCARTYAFRKMLHAGYGRYGAHLDDSTGFQVYQNIAENAQTSQAVRMTERECIFYKGEPVDTYYYSTSAGCSTNALVWGENKDQEIPYCVPKRLGSDLADEYSPQKLMEEETFKRYIKSVVETDYEKNEAWYRWQYTVSQVSAETLQKKLMEQYEKKPTSIYCMKNEKEAVNECPNQLGAVQGITVTKRLPGGVVDEIKISGSTNTYFVKGELAIRNVLCEGTTPVIRQDESQYLVKTTLPSAFFMVEVGMEDANMVQYKLYGGGFGHGVGMSQNGAKNMADAGFTAEEILQFFYENVSVGLMEAR